MSNINLSTTVVDYCAANSIISKSSVPLILFFLSEKIDSSHSYYVFKFVNIHLSLVSAMLKVKKHSGKPCCSIIYFIRFSPSLAALLEH